MYHWHLDYPSRGRLGKTFLKWGRRTKSFRSPGLYNLHGACFVPCLNWHIFSDLCFSNKNQTIGFTPCIENVTSTVYSAFYWVYDAFTNSLIRENEHIFYLLVVIIFSGAFSTLVKAYDWLKFYLAFFNTRIQIDTCGHRRGLPGSFPAGNR